MQHAVQRLCKKAYGPLNPSVNREIRCGIAPGLGVVNIKDNEVESPELIATRIAHAVKVLGVERVRRVHPDCGFWMLSCSVADRKMQALVAGRDKFLGFGWTASRPRRRAGCMAPWSALPCR